jgi:prepilin-type N-terminal cleavage/methylation domain-containing protein
MTKGFTLIEMIVVIGIGLVILTTTTVLLLGGQRRVVKISAEEQILSDIRSAQIKAMTGNGSQGVYFGSSAYTLYKGSFYNANDGSNFVVNLGDSVQLTTTFSGSNIVFLAVSGEINDYVNGSDSISITDATDNTQRVIHFNKYGVPILEN